MLAGDRDAPALNEAVLTIVADSVEKMSEVRKGDTSLPSNTLIEVIDWGVRAFGSYVGMCFYFALIKIDH